MIQPLDGNDMTQLRPVQKAAIYEALFMVISIDRQITPEEVLHFDVAVEQIKWGLEPLMMELIKEKARMRVKSTLQREAWLSWIKEIALLLPSQNIREKVTRTMGVMAVRCGTAKEPPVRGLLNEYLNQFQLSPDAIRELQTEMLPLLGAT
jgi:hypothetical protein